MVMKSSKREIDTTDLNYKNNNNDDHNKPMDELPRFQWGAKRRLPCQRAAASAADQPPSSDAKVVAGPTSTLHQISRQVVVVVVGPSAERARQKRSEKPAAEFRLTLTKDEVEADFIAMTGSKPPRKPNRRPRHLQDQVESGFPGLLQPKTIAPDRYGALE